MRFNNKELIHISHSNPILEGRMSYAKLSNGYSSKGKNEFFFFWLNMYTDNIK